MKPKYKTDVSADRLSKFLFIGVYALFALASNALATPQLYQRLDALIAAQDSITLAKQQALDNLNITMHKGVLTPLDEYVLNDRLYNEYIAFKFDSAFHYASLNVEIAKRLNDNDRLSSSLLKLAYIESVAGMFDKAGETLALIDEHSLGDSLRAEYYNECSKLFMFRGEFAAGTIYEQAYADSAAYYRAHTIDLAPPSSNRRTFSRALSYCEQGEVDKAIELLTRRLEAVKQGERQYSVITSTLAYFYQRKGDEQMREQYLLQSAISDVMGCVRENTSLRALSLMLLDKGDVDRAFTYLNTSINDAMFYGTRLRNIQSAQLAPIIIKAYNDNRTANYNRTLLLLAVVIVVAVVLVLALVFALRQSAKRREAARQVALINNELHDTVAALKDANDRLAQTSLIKNEYLARFLTLCSANIDRTDQWRRALYRMVKERRFEQLNSQLKNTSAISESIELFHDNFDEAFLNIYPDFVADVNELLSPDARLETSGKKLTTELRILALMRLGITDNATIAGILRNSLSTIYTYRSRMKAKAVSPATFEQHIKSAG